MLKSPITFIITLFLLFVYSCKFSDTKKDSTKVTSDAKEQFVKPDLLREEYEFIIEAASESLMEVQLGQIAQQNAASPKVKEFATNMIADHSKVNELLKELATSKNISIPSAPAEKHNGRLQTLSRLKGMAFDKEYIAFMIQDHDEDLQNYHKEATEGKDPETKAFASGQLEILQQHLDIAKTIMNTLKQ